MKFIRAPVLMLAFVIFIMSAIPVKAVGLAVTPYLLNTERADCSLKFNSETATCGATVLGNAGTNKISATLTLQQKNANGTYKDIEKWPTESVSKDTMSLSKTYAVTRGNTYKLCLSADVVRNGVTETVTANSGDVKCE